MAQRAIKTHTGKLAASIAAALPQQNEAAILAATLESPDETRSPTITKGKTKAQPAKENRSTSGVVVGKPIAAIEDAAKKRNIAAASHIAADIIKTATEEGGRWKKHYLALFDATKEVREYVATMLKDNRKAFNDKLKAAGETHITKTLTASAYVRISEMLKFIEALNKGMTRDTVPDLLTVGGTPMAAEDAQPGQLVGVARQFLSGNAPAQRAPAAERLDPVSQFKLAILRAVSRKELSPSILTHRWIANHATKIIDDWTKSGVLKNLSYENAAKVAAVVNADPSAKVAKKVA